MSRDVKITITTVKPIGNVGFGCPLILEENAAKEVAYKEVSNLAELEKAGYETTSKVYKVARLMFMQEHAPSKIAVCSANTTAQLWLKETENIGKDWRQLVVVGGGDTEPSVKDIMTAIEAENTYPKMFYANLPLTDATALTVAGIERTVVCYYTPTDDVPVPVAALVGEVAGLEVGSYTLNNMTVKGVKGLELTETEVEAIHAKGGITFVVSAGDIVASEGKTAGGLYVDNVDGDDYIKQQLEYKTQKVFNNNLKVPYTNVGIALLESAAAEVMTDAQNKGIVDNYVVSYALRENTTAEDRAARRYVGGIITYERAGAIHKIEVNCAASF